MSQVSDRVHAGSDRVDRSASDAAAERLAAIVQGASAGDEAAWGELIELYGRRVFAMAKSRFGDPDVAEEIAQSVFATIATKLSSGQYAERGRFEAWLFRVTMNRIRDEARRLKRHAHPTDPAELSLQESRSDGPRTADRGRIAGLRRAMDELSEVDREVIELRHHGGMSFKEMAELLDEPVGTLLARHHRALRKLRQIMEEAPEAENKPEQAI